MGNNMYAYCNNNPVILSDPQGYAAGWTNTVAICDGGSGLSTEERRILRTIAEESNYMYTAETLGITSDQDCRITQGSVDTTIPPLLKFLAGQVDGGLLLGIIGLKITSPITGMALTLTPIVADIIISQKNPGLHEGNYTIYTVDITVSKSVYINPASGRREIHEVHRTQSFFSLAEPTGNIITHFAYLPHEYYTITRAG